MAGKRENLIRLGEFILSEKTRIRLFFLASILFCLGANFAHPITPTVIQNLGLHDYMFGVAYAGMASTNFLFSPFWGKINVYLSSRKTMLINSCQLCH